MGYRRPTDDANEAKRWRAFRTDKVRLLERAGLPGLLADRDQFRYFVEYSYVPMPGEGATSSMFDVDDLDQVQRAALHELVRSYVEEFGEADADASGLLAILASGEV